MCFPPAIIAGAALMLGGSVAKYFGQEQADHAQERTFAAEQLRQKGFQKEQDARFQDSLASSTNLTDPAAMAKAAGARNDAFTAVTKSASPAASGYLPGSSGAPAIVGAHAAAEGAKSDAATGALAHALASLSGFGDQMQANNIAIGRNSQAIDQSASAAAGSRSVLQAELDAAKQKGSTLRGLGSLAQQFGSALVSGGIGGAGGLGPIATPDLSNLAGGHAIEDIFAHQGSPLLALVR